MDIGLDYLKTASKKKIRNTGEVLGNKIAYAVTKSRGDKIVKQESVEKITIPSGERNEILFHI